VLVHVLVHDPARWPYDEGYLLPVLVLVLVLVHDPAR